MESLAGAENVPRFIAAYEKLIAEFADETRRVVLVAPVAALQLVEFRAQVLQSLVGHGAPSAASG